MDIKAMGEAVRQSRAWGGMNTATGSNWGREEGSKAHRLEESKSKRGHTRAAHRRRSREHLHALVSEHLIRPYQLTLNQAFLCSKT